MLNKNIFFPLTNPKTKPYLFHSILTHTPIHTSSFFFTTLSNTHTHTHRRSQRSRRRNRLLLKVLFISSDHSTDTVSTFKLTKKPQFWLGQLFSRFSACSCVLITQPIIRLLTSVRQIACVYTLMCLYWCILWRFTLGSLCFFRCLYVV